jgi:hypothetical protein
MHEMVPIAIAEGDEEFDELGVAWLTDGNDAPTRRVVFGRANSELTSLFISPVLATGRYVDLALAGNGDGWLLVVQSGTAVAPAMEVYALSKRGRPRGHATFDGQLAFVAAATRGAPNLVGYALLSPSRTRPYAFDQTFEAALVDSNGPKGNTGFPSAAEEISHFVSMLRKAKKHMTDEDISALEKSLAAASQKGAH